MLGKEFSEKVKFKLILKGLWESWQRIEGTWFQAGKKQHIWRPELIKWICGWLFQQHRWADQQATANTLFWSVSVTEEVQANFLIYQPSAVFQSRAVRKSPVSFYTEYKAFTRIEKGYQEPLKCPWWKVWKQPTESELWSLTSSNHWANINSCLLISVFPPTTALASNNWHSIG